MVDASSRADRLLERLDVELKKLPTAAARRRLLENLITGWEGRYLAWQRTEGQSEWCPPGQEPASAVDFVVTLSGLAARMRSVEA